MHRLTAVLVLASLSLWADVRASAAPAPTLGATAAMPSNVTAGVATTVTVTAAISNPTPLPGGVNLLRENVGGKATILGVMHDDGLNGDTQAGDHIYTLQVTLNEAAPGTVNLVVSAAFKGRLNRVQSAPIAVTVTAASGSPPVLTEAQSGLSVIQGQSAACTVSFGPDPGFTQLAALSVAGLPAGVTGAFTPPAITSGEFSNLMVTAARTQPPGDYPLTLTASATVNGVPQSQSLSVTLHVLPVTTSFIGRTVVDDALETPLAGVTVHFLGRDRLGNPTGASATTVSDASGNFLFTNLPASYAGWQLISYDGLTATAPAGKYAGVNLSYNLVAGQVTAAPVLIHLPRIDNAETVMVQQGAAADQTFTFKSIPHLSVTVYAGTTFTLADGSQPNPFPLIAVQVPVDRLPDTMPQMQGGVMPFIVAFQPANTVSSQPVAVTFPNTLMTPPNTDVELSTLDPTKGYMVQYGTGMVTPNGLQIVPDLPNQNQLPAGYEPGQRYGLVHFDWHGPAVTPNMLDPGPDGDGSDGGGGMSDMSGSITGASCHLPNAKTGNNGSGQGGSASAGDPVDLASGIQSVEISNIFIPGPRGPLQFTFNYRTFTSNVGPLGLGVSDNYNYQLSMPNGEFGSVINVIMPNGSQMPLARQADGTYRSTTDAMLLGVVLTVAGDNEADLRFKNGTVYHFIPYVSAAVSTGLLSTITDRNGNVTTLTRNSSDPLQFTKITDPVGRSLTFAYGNATYPNLITSVTDPAGRTVHYAYTNTNDLFGTLVLQFPLLTSVTDPAGGVTQYGYQSLPNGAFALGTITDPRGIVRVRNTFDDDGHVIQQTEGDGGIIHFNYTLLNPLVPTSPILQTVVTDPLGRQTTYRFSPQGYLLGVTDPSGQTVSYTLDPGTSQPLGVSQSSDVAAPGDTTATYDANGNVLTETDTLGNTTTFTYEPTFNQVTSVTDPLGHVSKFTYDTHGNLLTATDANGHESQLTYNSTGQVLTATDPLGKVTQFSYDPAGDLAAVTDPLGHTAGIAYDAISRPVRVADPLGRVSTVQYDSLDRVLSTTDPLGHSVSFSYDSNGNLLTLTDALGHTNTFTYDALNRPLTRKTPLGRMDTRQYDLAGNLTQFTDRRGQVSRFAYDVLDQLTGEQYQDGSTVATTYDAYGRTLYVADTAGGAYTYAYDLDSRLIGQASPNGAIQYAYDAASELTARQVAGQAAATYTYDPAGRLLSAALGGTGLQFTYDDRDDVTGITRANGVDSQFTYDDAGRLTGLSHAKGASILYAQSYTNDAASQRTASTLSSAQPFITQPVVNTYDAENHLLTNGATTDTYDANGNLTAETNAGGVTHYAWDTRGRLTTLTRPNGSTLRFTYDPDSEMIAQTDSATGQTRSYLLDALTNVVAYNDGVSGEDAVLTGLGIDDHFALIAPNGAAEYGLTDVLGSTTAVADGNGAVQARFDYEPYGQTTATGTASNYPFQYTGRVPISNSLYYNRARFYNPVAGRFISEDPTQFLGGVNLYAYTNDAPTDGTDDFGTADDTSEDRKKILEDARTAFEIGKATIEYGNALSDPCKNVDQVLDAANNLSDTLVDPLGGLLHLPSFLEKPVLDPLKGAFHVLNAGGVSGIPGQVTSIAEGIKYLDDNGLGRPQAQGCGCK